MIRICKIGNIIMTRTLHRHQVLSTPRKPVDWRVVISQRFYSSKKPPDRDRSGECPPCKKPPCKTPKPVEPTCLPKRPGHVCTPGTPQPCKTVPHYQECPKPNRMDELPKPVAGFAGRDKAQKTYYFRVFMIGAAIFLISVFAVYKIQTALPPRPSESKKRRKRPPKIKKIPERIQDVPLDVPYLLIGGGTASFSAFRAIKSADPEAKVLVVSSECDYPYMRPPLSKEIWFNEDPAAVRNLTFKQWNGTERSLYYEPDEFYTKCPDLKEKAEHGGVAVARGWTITHIDVVDRKAYLDDGTPISYGKCLIATGAVPKNLDIFETAEMVIQDKVTLYRNIFDFQELYGITEEASTIVVIGGGFLGSELACALARKGKKNNMKVVQIFREGGNMGKILPEYLSYWTTEKVKKEGVVVMPNSELAGVRLKDEELTLTLSSGEKLTADHVIVAIGVEPNTKLAKKSDLEVDPDLGGYLVNTELQARSHLYIAGDCACFYDTKLGRRRVEHHDHAVVSGRLAGENMAGASKPYWHQSMFWSDLGPDVGYEAIGIVDSKLPTVGVFAKATCEDSPEAVVAATGESIRSITEAKVPAECDRFIKKDPAQKKIAEQVKKEQSSLPQEGGEDFGKGVIFYLRDDIVVGIVLWNVFNRMNIARQVLQDERKYDDLNEVAKLFNIHGNVEFEAGEGEGDE